MRYVRNDTRSIRTHHERSNRQSSKCTSLKQSCHSESNDATIPLDKRIKIKTPRNDKNIYEFYENSKILQVN